MEFEDTKRPVSSPSSGPVSGEPGPVANDPDSDEPDGSVGPDGPTGSEGPDLLGSLAKLPAERGGIDARRRRARIAAALFDEPMTPIKIGRFTIVRELGQGGMGVVYVAYDEQLDRRVAVKLLRSDTEIRAQHRLQREAQAMARLSHPNVVTVHEVGTYQDQVFVAMEFVEGQDLRRWLKAEPRSWREIVAAFVQAGQGLAAAHDAGIVHRDFKPDNVLVGKDGRLRVADFGLAHALDAAVDSGEMVETARDSSPDRPPTSEGPSRLTTPLTRTGAIMGTPAYMPPEQFEGLRTDARSDQFSFCVALWEGLYGQRPFAGINLVTLAEAIRSGRIAEPPGPIEVPGWLRAVLVRGLSPSPAQRWPSMHALLGELTNDPQARRARRLRRVALSSVAALVLGGLTWLTATEIQHNARQRYWSGFTEQLLEIERERGVRQANDDALRARDATRMSVYRSYRRKVGSVDHEDPTVAAVLLREVEGSARESEAWVSAANEVLGQPISHAVLIGHRDLVTTLAFAPDARVVYSGSVDGTVWRWELESGRGAPIIDHEGDVTALALSPDGRTLVSSSKDGTARAWSSDAPDRSVVIAQHDDEVWHVAFSPDGRRVLTSSKDGIARIVELGTNASTELRGHVGAVYAGAFDSVGELVITASGDRSAKLWRVADGQELTTLVGHEAAIFHVRFIGPDRVLTGSDDGSVRLWRLGPAGLTNTSSEVLTRHEAEIAALDVHGSRFVSAAVDGSVRVGSLEPGHEPILLPGHANSVWAASFTPTGSHVVTASFDTTARIADGRGAPLVFEGHRESLLCALVDPSGRWLATGSYDGTVRLWDLTRPRLELPLEGHGRGVYDVEFDRSGQRVATASRDGSVGIWSAIDGARLARLEGGNESLNRAVFSPDGRLLATATKRGIVELWDPSREQLRALQGHEDVVWDVAFDAAGERLASASFDRSARIWSVSSGAELLVLRGHTDKVIAVDFEPAGERVVTASHDGTLRIWDAQGGAQLVELRGHTGKIAALARSPNARTLATGSDDHSARLWPDDHPEHSIVLRGHGKPVWSVAFDATGERLLTASYDGSARVWDTHDGSLLATLEGHSEVIWDARFAPDGRVITSSDDNTIRVWTPGSDAPTLVLSGHAEGVTSLALSPDGSRLVSASGDATAKIWRLDLLSADARQLHERLVAVTNYCLPPDQRVRDFAEEPGEAEAAFLACERGYGR